MRMEVLEEDAGGGAIIRMFDFTSDEVRALQVVVSSLAEREMRVAAHELPFIEPVENCRFTLEAGPSDVGLTEAAGDFRCIFSRDTWGRVVELIEPLASETNGYQWLADSPGGRWLLSRTGEW